MSASSSTEPVPALVLRHAETRPDHTALIYPDGRSYTSISYATLAERVAGVAHSLAARGLERGDHVVVLVPMSSELYVTLLAVTSLGAIAVFVEPASTTAEIARVIRMIRPRAFVGIARAHVLRLLHREVARVPIHVVVGPRPLATALAAPSLVELEAAGAGQPLPFTAVDRDEPILLTFSSGSTGVPKGATRSHEFLTAQHHAIGRLLAREPGIEDVHMSAFPIVLLSTLASGMTAVIPRLGRRGVDDVSGDELADLVFRYGVSVISGSPAFLAPLVAAVERRGKALDSVRRVVSGGAPVPLSLCEAIDEQMLPNGQFVVGYGSTEAEPIAMIDAAEVRHETAAATRKGAGLCVGSIETELELRLLKVGGRGAGSSSGLSGAKIEPSDEPLAIGPGGIEALCVGPGEVGEIAVCGPHVNRYYYRNPAAERANKIADVGGHIWHRTGDAGYLDGRGRLWLVGRVANIVRRAGASYHPAAVEAAAQTLEQVDRAALVGDGRGQTVLVVQLRRPRSLRQLWRRGVDRPRLGRQIIDHLADVGVPIDRVEFVARLPVDSRHRAKLNYPAIKREYR